MKNMSDFCIAVVLILQMIGASNLFTVFMRMTWPISDIKISAE